MSLGAGQRLGPYEILGVALGELLPVRERGWEWY